MIFGSVQFALFVKSLKTVRFLERYGSRYKILTENGNELRYGTVRAFYRKNGARGGLFGAVRLAVKNRNGKRYFIVAVTLFFKKRKTVRFWATVPRFFKSKSRKW